MSELEEGQERPLRFGRDYETYFDPASHLEQYCDLEGPNGWRRKFTMNTLYSLFDSGRVSGQVLLDIGTGPNIYNLIPVSKFVDDIILTDFAECNRKVLQQWLDKDPQAFDWEPFFRLQAAEEENEERWPVLQDELRRKVRRILPCDVTQHNPIPVEDLSLVDIVSSSLCLDAACQDLDSFTIAVRNCVSLIKEGGYFIMMGVLNAKSYPVGDEEFSLLPLEKSDIIQAMDDAGLTKIQSIEEQKKDNGPGAVDITDDGCYVIHGMKPLPVQEKTGCCSCCFGLFSF